MNGMEAHVSSGLNIGQRVIDKQAFFSCVANSSQRNVEDHFLWFDGLMFARDDHIVEHVEEIIAISNDLKFLHRKIT